MKKNRVNEASNFEINNSTEGESIEMKLRRIQNNKEPIVDTAPIIYTERKDGVLPETDIRTDRMEMAQEALTALSKTNLAIRVNNMKKRSEKNSGAEPIQGTDNK